MIIGLVSRRTRPAALTLPSFVLLTVREIAQMVEGLESPSFRRTFTYGMIPMCQLMGERLSFIYIISIIKQPSDVGNIIIPTLELT